MKLDINYQTSNHILLSSGVIIFIVDMLMVLKVNVDYSSNEWNYWIWVIANVLICLLAWSMIIYGLHQIKKNEDLEIEMKKEKHELDIKLKQIEVEEKSRSLEFMKQNNIPFMPNRKG